ncbi:MAG: lipoprotein-releasing system ATP-binding protein LolD [Chloroflexi bacterium]|nr:MAG: lipoprotein-releasing system ATP-binding protein LolD [Chloroflexota bacterium]PIE81003.1 MAG: lipoprotein-releasing system ATP-binding protein LolD [Chloroflexota bacterium]
MAIIEAKNVTKIYQIGEVETHALNGVSLDINEGEFAALVGPSGSGKTTMLQLMGCLDKPNSGIIRVNGQDVSQYKANKRAEIRREMIGFIFQFFALVPVLSAYENVELPLLLNNIGAKERKERIEYLLHSVGLADRMTHRPDQLSGGEQQRVAIARALAPSPIVVLADEPTANLDTENGQQAMDIMKKLNEETGTAFVFATHDPRVMAYASRVLKMQDGRLIDNGNHIT